MFASLDAACAALEPLAREFDATTLTPGDAARTLEQLGTIRRLVDGMVAKTAKRISDTSAHMFTGDRNAASFVAKNLGITSGEARDAIDTATMLEELPATDAAVRAGELSAKQAHMIAAASNANPSAERELLDAAQHGLAPLRDACIAARAAVENPDTRRARHHHERSFRHWLDADGMIAGRFRLAPEIGAQVVKQIDAETQRIFRSHKRGEHEPLDAYAADSFAAAVLGEHTEKKADPNATVHVFVDHDALTRGNALPGETCEIAGVGPVNVAWVRELLGSAFVTAIVKNGKDITTVAHLGRHIPAEVLTALIASGRECDIKGCNHRGYLERDHVREFAKGGPTALWNLIWLCYVHHRLKSTGWILGPPDTETGKRELAPPAEQVA
jgi:hypothetical protein